MMQRIILYIIATITIGLNSSAQEGISDPIERIYQMMKVDSIYSQIGTLYQSGNTDALNLEIKKYATECRILYGYQSIDYLNSLGFCINLWNKLQEADCVLSYGEEACKLIEILNLYDSEIDYGITYCMGCAYFEKGDFNLSLSKSIESYNKVFKVYLTPGLSLISSIELILWSAYKLGDISTIKKYAEEYLNATKQVHGSSSELMTSLKMIARIIPQEEASFTLMLIQKYGVEFDNNSNIEFQIQYDRLIARVYYQLANSHLAIDYINSAYTKCINYEACPKDLLLIVMSEGLEYLSTTKHYDNMIEVGTEILRLTENNKELDYKISALTGIGIAYGYKGIYDQAIKYLKEAIAILNAHGLYGTVTYLDTIDMLTGVYCDAQEFGKCRTIIQTYLPDFVSTFGQDSEAAILMKERLGWALFHLGDTDSAAKLFAECGESFRNLFFQLAEYLSEIDLYFLYAEYATKFKRLCIRASKLQRQDINSASYNAAITYKSFLISSQNALWHAVVQSNDTKIINAYNEYLLKRKQTRGYFSKEIFNSKNLDLLLYQKKIISMLKERGIDYFAEFGYSWQNVKASLPDKGTAIEFTSYTFENDSTMYYAQILNKNQDYPIVIALCSEDDIIKLSSKADFLQSCDFSALIWRKIEPYIKDSKDIYFAPDGVLQTIPIESMVNTNGDGLMSDMWNFHRLSSTRIICSNNDNNSLNSSKDICAYGGMFYSQNDEAKAMQSSNIPQVRSIWDYLPATLSEIECIRYIAELNCTGHYMIGDKSTEDSFKVLNADSPSIIHIATHGFYYSPEDFKDSRIFDLINDSIKGDMINIDLPLNRSGLIFSGAKDYLKSKSNPYGAEDGILTSYEISQLDLSHTELVVLSACETGLGETTEDGIAGLQRGFKKAGAKSILMSLWKVDDDATQKLMVEFYRNFLNGETKVKSLLNAQKAVRETPGFEAPEYWAGFILLDALN